MIPDSWVICRFEEIATYKAGRTPARESSDYWQKSSNNVPWVTISDMHEFGLITKTKETVTPEAIDNVFRGQIIPAGTLLMSFKLTIGRIATLGIDACHNEAIISITPKSNINPRYLGYFLSQVDYRTLQDRQIKGNTLNRQKINRIEIFVPPSEEQSSIADTLDLVRRAIANQDSALAVAGELKRAMTRKLFAHGLRGVAQKETKIGPMPESWRMGCLGQFANVISTPMAYTELQRSQQPVGENAVKVLGVKVADMNLPGNEVKLQTAVLEKMLDKATAEYRCAPPRTIVFPKRGAAIATNKKRMSTEWTAFDPNVIGIVAGNELDQDFLFQWLQMFDLRTITDDGPTPQLNKKNLLPLSIPIPPTLIEQREIVTILDGIDRKIDLHRKKRAVLDEMFKVLLHKLMTGEIQVSKLAPSTATYLPR